MEQLSPPRQWRGLWSADWVLATKLILSILQPSEPTIATQKGLSRVSPTSFLLQRRGYRIPRRIRSTKQLLGFRKMSYLQSSLGALVKRSRTTPSGPECVLAATSVRRKTRAPLSTLQTPRNPATRTQRGRRQSSSVSTQQGG
jgi:hypothetical protein